MKHSLYLPEARSRTWIHVIWTTLDAMPRIPVRKRQKFLLFLLKYCQDEEIYLDVANALEDHVHLLLMLNPKQSLSAVVRNIKEAAEQYLREEMLWEKDYRAYSLSPAKIPYLRRRIRRQEKIHRLISLKQELWELEPLGRGNECLPIAWVKGIG
ncbi:MAG: transposase [Bacteroidia bacterium]|nr:transposase [Bacteroidia bacterium]